jgi:lipoprotein Spr
MKKIILFLFFIITYSTTFSQSIITENKYKGEPLFDFIHEWYGTKYKYGGESKRGIDCSAFTLKLFSDVYKIPIPRTAQEQYKLTKRIPKDSLKDGDLVFFRTNYASTWHVGVYLTDGLFVHSKSKVGVTIDNLNDIKYNRMYYGAGRIN